MREQVPQRDKGIVAAAHINSQAGVIVPMPVCLTPGAGSGYQWREKMLRSEIKGCKCTQTEVKDKVRESQHRLEERSVSLLKYLIQDLRYGHLPATAVGIVQVQSKANDEIEWFHRNTEFCVGCSTVWRLASTAVLALFLSLNNEIKSGRMFFLHRTCYHLMRCRWRGGCPSRDQWLGVTPPVDCQSGQEI